MTMFSNKMLCRETSCRQSRVCSETRMPSRKTEGFCTGAGRRFSRLLQVAWSELRRRFFPFPAAATGCRPMFIPSAVFCLFPFPAAETGWVVRQPEKVVFASLFSIFFGSFQKAFFRAGVNITVIFFAADMMTVKPGLFARSWRCVATFGNFPAVFACQRRSLVRFEYAAVKKFRKIFRIVAFD